MRLFTRASKFIDEIVANYNISYPPEFLLFAYAPSLSGLCSLQTGYTQFVNTNILTGSTTTQNVMILVGNHSYSNDIIYHEASHALLQYNGIPNRVAEATPYGYIINSFYEGFADFVAAIIDGEEPIIGEWGLSSSLQRDLTDLVFQFDGSSQILPWTDPVDGKIKIATPSYEYGYKVIPRVNVHHQGEVIGGALYNAYTRTKSRAKTMFEPAGVAAQKGLFLQAAINAIGSAGAGDAFTFANYFRGLINQADGLPNADAFVHDIMWQFALRGIVYDFETRTSVESGQAIPSTTIPSFSFSDAPDLQVFTGNRKKFRVLASSTPAMLSVLELLERIPNMKTSEDLCNHSQYFDDPTCFDSGWEISSEVFRVPFAGDFDWESSDGLDNSIQASTTQYLRYFNKAFVFPQNYYRQVMNTTNNPTSDKQDIYIRILTIDDTVESDPQDTIERSTIAGNDYHIVFWENGAKGHNKSESSPNCLEAVIPLVNVLAVMNGRFVPALEDCFMALPRLIVYTTEACGAVVGSCSIYRPGDKLDRVLWLLWIIMFGVFAGSIIVRRWGA